jgi:uracil-DNA glycosylase
MDLYTYIYSNIPVGWEELFAISKDEIKQISEILEQQEKAGKRIVPDQENIFRVFYMSPPEKVNVVIVGQDPYFQILSNGKPRAQGFSFSVDKNDEVPSSLKNIYKEIKNCYPDSEIPKHGDISNWVSQGVLLLNICLTCVANEPNSHGKYKLWMPFISKFLKFMSEINKNLIFVLWGGEAQKAENIIEKKGFKNIIKGVHPSGLSAMRGFIGCKHFSLINNILTNQGKSPIEWLPREMSINEIRIKLISEIMNQEELKSLCEHYLPYHDGKNEIKIYSVSTLTQTAYFTHKNGKSDFMSYEEFLKEICKKLETVTSLCDVVSNF